MTESKAKRLIVAVTAGAVLLLAVLVCVLIYQLISIGVERANAAELEKEIAYYEALIEEKGETLEARRQRWWIERRARELGYTYDGDLELTVPEK